ncbi:TonB-dependent receptor [Gimibacter soli]|uniref:TonB-dependent receptor n=1 Tax=Gimibacter soli TaxID=3024400 RepID=A0AAF0BKX7_9PROT|nr:TonB-dependent receptor [Gimibacter soli]WCL53477.1 TonB-dependent receptor [Gimibacter soli]
MNTIIVEREAVRGDGPSRARLLLCGTSLAALLTVGLAAPANAAEGDEVAFEEIVVTGIRKSLKESADIKRNARGVVDGVVAEDIGKFPDSNIAESLQRITGVAINRQAGEGSQVTVRGFGAGFNQVTINGRTMPTADIPVIGGDGQGLLGQASDRAFDFSTLASESVSSMQVYKSGRADIASGGVGATINVNTRKPLDNDAGLTGTVVAKAAHDTHVDQGNKVTPELAGFMSWSNDESNFGVALFAGYSKRDSAAGAIRNAGWDVISADAVLDPSSGLLTNNAKVTGLPTDGRNVAIARDSRYQFTELSRERINGQAVIQFNPTERFRFTADALYAESSAKEDRTDLSNWFDRPFDQLAFDDNPVATSVFLSENKGGGVKDFALQQSHSATKDKLESFGVNLEFDATDGLTFILDGHTSKASVRPDARTGFAQTNVGMAMPVVLNHSVDYSSGFPQIVVNRDDSIRSNGDGVYDLNDVSTQISNDNRDIYQLNDIDQIDLRGEWDLDDKTKFTFGANYRTQRNETYEALYQQVMGNWGANNPGDVERLAPGALELYDWDDAFKEFPIPSGLVGVRGNALDIFEAASAYYLSQGNTLNLQQENFDIVEEDVLSFYGQFDGEFDLADRRVRFSAGLRYEQTDVTAFSQSAPTTEIVWQGDQDFARVAGAGQGGFSVDGSYHNFLPNLDLAIDLTDTFVTRFSYSKTMSRTGYDNLKASTSLSQPSGPTALGGTLTANTGTPGLLPLVSENFDVSFEWYYGDDDWLSVGLFHKNVKNFVGSRTVQENLFGIRNATSGEAGTRSGQALDALQSIGITATNAHLFAMSALIDQLGSVNDAVSTFQAHVVNGALDPAYYVSVETDYDVRANGNDPLWIIDVTRPLNIESAAIRGIELAGQHFFGDTGFGIAASYTLVDGDIGYDVTKSPTESQFALEGLSDTANLTLIYEKDRISARASYNWRDKFLSDANRGDSYNNPTFTDSFATIDVSVSYNVTDDLVVSLDAINITGENTYQYNRAPNQLWFARENAPRFFLGARYKF